MLKLLKTLITAAIVLAGANAMAQNEVEDMRSTQPIPVSPRELQERWQLLIGKIITPYIGVSCFTHNGEYRCFPTIASRYEKFVVVASDYDGADKEKIHRRCQSLSTANRCRLYPIKFKVQNAYPNMKDDVLVIETDVIYGPK